jgi:hypothetical protein
MFGMVKVILTTDAGIFLLGIFTYPLPRGPSSGVLGSRYTPESPDCFRKYGAESQCRHVGF